MTNIDILRKNHYSNHNHYTIIPNLIISMGLLNKQICFQITMTAINI
jgi:hypothetical protein